MDLFKKYGITPMKALKALGVVVVVIVVASFLMNIAERSTDNFSFKRGETGISFGGARGMGLAVSEAVYDMDDFIEQSAKNIAPAPPREEPVPGDDAEEYEVKEYNALFEMARLEEMCGKIMALKADPDIIFERANEYDTNCRYVFKAKADRVQEVLDLLNSLDPKELSEHVYTIKRTIEDFTSQQEILERKLETIEDTLDSAVIAYDSITSLAVRTQDAETLAKVIESKLRTLERLTQERLNVSSQLDRLSRRKAEQLDRLEYAYFHVTVIERKYVDLEEIGDSWKTAIRDFVDNLNNVLQDVSINLLAILFTLVQYVLYLAILLVVVKYGWRFVKAFWKK